MKIAFEELSIDKNLIFTDQVFSELFETYISQYLKNKKKFRKFFYKIIVFLSSRKNNKIYKIDTIL